ncbi:T-lymphoma invasion and metastasis-inducing protein 1, partial [Xenoophorus captivus]
EDTVRLLRAEIKKLEQKIDMDEKMKKMGEMQLSAVTDTKKRKTILDQVSATWPACKEESCPTLNAFWPSPLAPPS